MKYVIYVKQLLCYSIFNLLWPISLGSEIYNPLLQMLAMLGAEIIGNLCSESRKRHFWRPEIQKFPGGSCPRTPLVKIASGARLSIGQAICTRNTSMQKGWLRPWLLYVRFSTFCTLTESLLYEHRFCRVIFLFYIISIHFVDEDTIKRVAHGWHFDKCFIFVWAG